MGYKVFISHSVRDLRDVGLLADILSDYQIFLNNEAMYYEHEK